jgi:ornithine cyclodeaminase/alanine dehydrogenase-like protein (mu-crystallin family)
VEPIRIAFIGAGAQASYLYARLIETMDDVELVGVRSRSEGSARQLGEKLRLPWFSDMARLKSETVAVSASSTGPVSATTVHPPTARSRPGWIRRSSWQSANRL